MSGNRRYRLCFDTPLAFGCRRKGSHCLSDASDGRLAVDAAEALCRIYGEGTHWVEDEDGDIVTDEDILDRMERVD